MVSQEITNQRVQRKYWPFHLPSSSDLRKINNLNSIVPHRKSRVVLKALFKVLDQIFIDIQMKLKIIKMEWGEKALDI